MTILSTRTMSELRDRHLSGRGTIWDSHAADDIERAVLKECVNLLRRYDFAPAADWLEAHTRE